MWLVGGGGRQEESNMSRPLVSIENGALSREMYEFLIFQKHAVVRLMGRLLPKENGSSMQDLGE
jgi:hypothetical protein